MVTDIKFGLIPLNMRGIGVMTRQMVRANSSTPMEMFMRENGYLIRHMGEALTLMPMEPTTTVTGLRISSMAGEWSPGLMVRNTKASI